MKIHARITWTVEVIRTCIFLIWFYVWIQLRVWSILTFFFDFTDFQVQLPRADFARLKRGITRNTARTTTTPIAALIADARLPTATTATALNTGGVRTRVTWSATEATAAEPTVVEGKHHPHTRMGWETPLCTWHRPACTGRAKCRNRACTWSVVHVGGTRCVPSSTDHIVKIVPLWLLNVYEHVFFYFYLMWKCKDEYDQD